MVNRELFQSRLPAAEIVLHQELKIIIFSTHTTCESESNPNYLIPYNCEFREGTIPTHVTQCACFPIFLPSI